MDKMYFMNTKIEFFR